MKANIIIIINDSKNDTKYQIKKVLDSEHAKMPMVLKISHVHMS